MNWKHEAIDKLKNYEARKQALTNITEELHRLEIKSTSIRSASADSSPVKGGGSGREEALLNNLCHRAELERQLEEARIWCRTVENALSVLTDQERLVLNRFYIRPAKGNVDRLCEELHLEKSRIYSLKNQALEHVTRALYGFIES